jgi:hypothetical protein
LLADAAVRGDADALDRRADRADAVSGMGVDARDLHQFAAPGDGGDVADARAGFVKEAQCDACVQEWVRRGEHPFEVDPADTRSR